METNKKQTAVEWLFYKLIIEGQVSIDDLLKAIEIEKQQIIDAYENGYFNAEELKVKLGTEYYKETYGHD